MRAVQCDACVLFVRPIAIFILSSDSESILYVYTEVCGLHLYSSSKKSKSWFWVTIFSSICNAFADVIASYPAGIAGRAMQNIVYLALSHFPTCWSLFVCYINHTITRMNPHTHFFQAGWTAKKPCASTNGWILKITWAITVAQHAVLDIATTHVSCKTNTCVGADIATMNEHVGSNWIDINQRATFSYD